MLTYIDISMKSSETSMNATAVDLGVKSNDGK